MEIRVGRFFFIAHKTGGLVIGVRGGFGADIPRLVLRSIRVIWGQKGDFRGSWVGEDDLVRGVPLSWESDMGKSFPPLARGETESLAWRIFSALVFLGSSFGKLGLIRPGREAFVRASIEGI